MPKWEYAMIFFSADIEIIDRSSPKYELLPESIRADWDRLGWTSFRFWEEALWIGLPGLEPEKRVMWNPTLPGYTSVTTFNVLNELGADGWELVSETVLASTVSEHRGHDRAGRPIELRLCLKRQLDA